ncbi:MAG: hypothetical protein HF978_06510 [Desulfobacteraceae bacterium]|nr:replication-relaxation family protein [Desulfobacteraceae bacterium]MBC2755183.1 hypothetical protein [Desulfobacteraceae bacterium]
MISQITKKDKELIEYLGKFKLLTILQLAALSQRSSQVIRRRLRHLIGQGIVSSSKRIYSEKRGRPEDIIFLTKEGRQFFLKQYGIASTDKDDDKTFDIGSIDHELLLNWVLIHFIHLENETPDMSIKWLTLNTVNLQQEQQNRISIMEHIAIDSDPPQKIEFVPDSVLSITHSKLQKSLLFFLEVDMGTEAIVSANHESKDIRQKIINYQMLFHTGRYKRYEEIFNAKFNGFRLLFLTNTAARFVNLCRLAQEMPPSDFTWLTHQEHMFSNGLFDKIWARGGKHEDIPQSILGDKFSSRITVFDKIK